MHPAHQQADTNLPDSARILTAARFATQRHRSQRRKGADRRPYIEHPIDVATTLATIGGVTDADVLMAALLHDTVEDTDTTFDELESHFGARVAALVAELTDDKSLPPARRKELQIEHAPHLSAEAKLLKLGDKICNVRDVTSNPPVDWSLERRRWYFDWSRTVIDGLRGTNAALEAHYDEVVARAYEVVEALEGSEESGVEERAIERRSSAL